MGPLFNLIFWVLLAGIYLTLTYIVLRKTSKYAASGTNMIWAGLGGASGVLVYHQLWLNAVGMVLTGWEILACLISLPLCAIVGSCIFLKIFGRR